ncbi:hypothetical protein CY35_15G090800 [Sphagnum magellanicum]|nr:hypothetical protein CY35_15G090800 [Sphagnum magellanicum]
MGRTFVETWKLGGKYIPTIFATMNLWTSTNCHKSYLKIISCMSLGMYWVKMIHKMNTLVQGWLCVFHMVVKRSNTMSILHLNLVTTISQFYFSSKTIHKCGEAIEQNDLRMATQIITKLRELSSPNGNGAQRMAHYVTNALVAKMSGTGAQLYTSLDNNSPSTGTILRAYRSIVMDVPYVKFGIQFCTTQILDAFKGATHVHVIDYGILYGLHWPCLIKELGKRPEGPPHLRITGIEHPRKPNSTSSERVQEIGQRLAKFAKLCGVPFEYNAIAKEWETITLDQLDLREGEVLAINCFFKLQHLLDNQVVPANPRLLVLKMIRTMNPKVFVTGVENASCNEPFFISRLSNTIKYYSIHFDTLDVVTSSISEKHRIVIEKHIFGRQILNIIACEGTSRVERFESYKQWQRCIQRSGFIQRPLSLKNTAQKVNYESILGSYDKRFGIGKDDGWLFIGWKNAIMCAFSTWKPIPLRMKV